MFCTNCGTQIPDGSAFCPNCGKNLSEKKEVAVRSEETTNTQTSTQTQTTPTKSRLAAGLLGIFLGIFGIHNFYLGYTKKAIIQVLLGTVGFIVLIGPVISGIWGFVEGILILTGKIKVDGHGNPLKD